MKFTATQLGGVRLIGLDAIGDSRGIFARTMCRDEFDREGLTSQFVQQNMSVSPIRGTVRGLHMQAPPHSEVKLVRCVRGSIIDVIVDLRPDSDTFLRHEKFELSDKNRLQLYVPAGFAHGFQTLSSDVEVTYLVSAGYQRESEIGLRWNDPMLKIEWPAPATVLSEKDSLWPLFEYDQTISRGIGHPPIARTPSVSPSCFARPVRG